MFYILTITVSALLIALGNTLLRETVFPLAFWGLLLYTVLSIIGVFAIDGLSAFVIRRLPERWFAPEASAFSVPKWEKNLYRRTGIARWKKHVPEWGCFTGFHKDRLREPSDSAYLGRFLLESNYGVAGHVAGALFGFLILLLPFFGPVSVSLPVAAVNAILSLLPTMILRYNTPALRSLYRRTREREQRRKIPMDADACVGASSKGETR